MRRRARWPIAGFLGLGLVTGCAMPFARDFHPSLASPQASSSKAPPMLPAQEGAEVCLALGESLTASGHEAEAIGQFERARIYQPKLKGIAWKLGVLYDRIGEHKKAMAEFELALKEHGKNPDLLNDVGYAAYNKAKWDVAEAYFKEALSLQPKHERAQVNLGLVYAQQGRDEEALGAFAKVVSPAEAHANLAFVYVTQGKQDEARRTYQEALRLDPDLQIAHAAIFRLDNPLPPEEAKAQTNDKAKPPAPHAAPAASANATAKALRPNRFVERIGESQLPESQPREMPLPAD